MDQFVREVDEEYRRERIAQIWKRYGGVFVGLALLVVAGIGGWRYWQHLEAGRAEAASTRLETALRLSREGKGDEAEKALDALAADAPTGYRILARFRFAAEAGKGSVENGVKAYAALADDAAVDGALRDLARLRSAMLRMSASDDRAITPDLERLAVPAGTWRHTAREMLGLAALKAGDADGASRWFDQIAQDRETPPGLRGRLEIYTALAAGGPVQVTQ